MATTVREQVLVAFHALINAGLPGAITGAVVERNRRQPVPEGHPSFVVLLDGPQVVLSDETGATRYLLTVEVEGYASAASDAGLGPALNALYGELTRLALSDFSLGNLAVDVREGDMPDVYIDPDAAKPTGAFAMSFEIEYSTATGDPFTLGP